MKKIIKSKILLAVLAVTLVASMALAGTYSWFVKTGELAVETGGTANVRAAYIELTVDDPDSDIDIEVFHPYIALSSGNGNYMDLLKDTDNLDRTNYGLLTNADDDIESADGTYLLYPGDAIRVTFGIDDIVAKIDHDRDVIVGIDASAIEDAFDAAITTTINSLIFVAVGDENGPAGNFSRAVCTDDILQEITLNDGTADYYDDGIYYFYVSAGDDEITLDGIGFVAELGIIGVNRNQNHYMTKDGALTIDENDLIVNVTVVQATEQAVIDVFGPAVATQFSW